MEKKGLIVYTENVQFYCIIKQKEKQALISKNYIFFSKGETKMKSYPIGVQIVLRDGIDLEAEFNKALDMGLSSCQLCIWNTKLFGNAEFAEKVRATIEKTGFRVSALWAGWSGPCEWNFTAGPATIGLVPPAYRFLRVNELKAASDFAAGVGIKRVVTHLGFLPENPDDPNFNGTVAAIRHLARYMKSKGQQFLFETGQETPITMLRTIQAVGEDNLGINFDTANLILYGKGNPVDALDVFGKYVMDTHIKDGMYPTDGMSLGKEVKAGEGKANIREIVKKLDALGYEGIFTIEREISGEKQIQDIADARDLLLAVFEEL